MALKATTSSSGSGLSDLSSVWTRAITGKSEWPDKEEFLDVIYWLRQIVGLVLGLIWGTFAFQGMIKSLIFEYSSELVLFEINFPSEPNYVHA